ncbi:type II and III secretion system protein family protein [Tritonibacter mobilis]|uniref:General secretion pathway protein n=1 Tax=Tritonibacter mobilis F1926 TaxID=1265309 RepID=A0A1B1A478_9RHOB|nr:type II and III secretion system protein family protein [Tritonibacter mobilis]ANP41331.1 general secretion pathway protein [Tritonibacter mobilis F1926]KJZ25577.1 general secretion pathway protein [Tritonibacter mobilis]MBU3032586.1 type II and III secretion system protein family protein [Tritonibacter mobilis]WHQ81788.1 type II and III secretion system protein family protein [Tritonibacter mobilis]
MSVRRYCAAALTGLTLLLSYAPSPVMAQGISVLKKGTNAVLDVPMNRAVVVEADVPFAELSIANPGIADISSLSDRTIYVLGKSPGMTTLTLLDGSGGLITNVDVRVAADVSEFKQRLQQILPNEKIEVRTANDGIVLSGTVSSAQRLQRALDLAERYAPDRVSNLMTVGGIQQVMLKVRFAEMERSVSKSLGGSMLIGSSDGSISTGTFLNRPEGGNVFGPSAGTNSARLNSDTLGAAIFGFDIGAVQFNVLLEALEQKGLVRTLAEPNLSALSGQEASFLAGGEYPVPVAQEEGVVTVEFKPFGIELNFIPRVVDGDLINLELKAAVSAIDPTNSATFDGFSINAFSRRETATTVELRDGESFAIAGLIEDEFRDGAAQVPWLGDVPVLGALFRSADYERNQSELVIIVSAHLVTPTRGEALALPTDRIRPPSEKNLFLFGRTERAQSGAAGEVANQDFNGSYGYLLD